MKAISVVKIAPMSIASRIVLGSRFDDEFEFKIIDDDIFWAAKVMFAGSDEHVLLYHSK